MKTLNKLGYNQKEDIIVGLFMLAIYVSVVLLPHIIELI